MPTFSYQAKGFPKSLGKQLRGRHKVSVRWAELVHAAITVGRKNWAHVFKHGSFSVAEITWRAAIVYANLREDPAGRLRRSNAYDDLDPSEKGAISYFFGLMSTKLIASRLLNTPWIEHLDRTLAPTLVRHRRKRPDLVGFDHRGDWSVFEAKGRSNSAPADLVDAAKGQAQLLAKIGGVAPVRCVGAAAAFPDGYQHLQLADPSTPTRDSFTAEIDPGRLLRIYYDRFRPMLKSGAGRSVHDDSHVLGLPGLDAQIALPRSLAALLRERSEKLEPELLLSTLREASPRSAADDEDEGTFFGSDGVIVRLGASWNVESMQIEPPMAIEE